MANEGKLRLLYLYKLLNERTDEDHTLSTVQLIKLLEDEYGISSHRVTISTDIKLLQEYGFDIEVVESTQNKYYMASRNFEPAEVKILIDAVASSKVITEKKSRALIKKLIGLAGPMSSHDLNRNIRPEDRIKSKNEKFLYCVDNINSAINSRKKVSFTYFTYDAEKKKVLRNDGEPYVFSPYELIWNGDYYYAVGWSDKHGKITSFRVDRMASVPVILDEEITEISGDFDAAEYIKINYHMFGGEIQTVELLCDASVMDSIIDRFGYNVETVVQEDGRFIAKVNVAVNNVFFGWVFGFDILVQILSPIDVVEKYKEMVRRGV